MSEIIEIFKTIWHFIKYAFNGGWRHWVFIFAMAGLGAFTLGLWAGIEAAPAIYVQWVNHLHFSASWLKMLGIRPDQGGMIYTDMSDSVPWGMYISFFVFWVGIAAAGVLFGMAAYVFRDKGFMRVAPVAEAQAIAAITVAMLLVFLDVGRPIRTIELLALPILLNFHLPNWHSMFDYDFIVLTSYLIINIIGVFLAVHWYRRGPKYAPPKWLMYAFMVIAGPLAIGIHTVTAFISQALTARPYWNSPLLAPAYVATALAAGPALLVLVLMIAEKHYKGYKVPKYVYEKTIIAATVALVVGLYFTLSEAQETFWYTTEPLKRVQAIGVFLSPFVCNIMKPMLKDYAFYFAGHSFCRWGLPGTEYLAMLNWVWIILGSLAVLLVVFVPPLRKRYKGVALLATMILLAVVCEKTFRVVEPAYIPDVMGVLHPYFPTPIEVAVTIAAHALGLLVYILVARPVLVALIRHYGAHGEEH